MEIQNQVQIELHKIHRSRNRIGYIPNPLSLFISVYFQRAQLVTDARWWWVIILVVVGTIVRMLVGEILFQKWSDDVKWVRGLSALGFICLGVGWALHFSDVYYHYGASSSHVSYTLLVVAAYMTAASTSLVADKVSYHIFVGLLAFGVIGTYLSHTDYENTFIVLNVILYYFFSVSNFKISHKQLCDLLTAQLTAESEKNRLNKIINTVPGFVGLIDKHQTVYLANQTTLNLYPDIIGRKIGNIDPTSTWERDVINFMQSSKMTDVYEEQTNFLGQSIHAILNIQRLDDGGVIIASIIVTDLVEAKKLIREQEAKAHYTAKLASLGEMAAGIAHEVNNPLSIIQGSANIVRRLVSQEPIDIENIKLLTTKMIETSDRISKTIKSLKALSRNAENDPKTKVLINQVVAQSLDISEAKFKQNGVELKWDPHSPEFTVLARDTELLQVLINLLGNSLDAIKELNEKWVEIKLVKVEESIDILVIDSGKGIPLEIQKKILEPFFTTKDVNQGTGLGLSISKTIIKDFDGELTLVPEASNTTFRIRLPIAHD